MERGLEFGVPSPMHLPARGTFEAQRTSPDHNRKRIRMAFLKGGQRIRGTRRMIDAYQRVQEEFPDPYFTGGDEKVISGAEVASCSSRESRET
jgi:hypothetical protein